eukprot:g18422.t1
MGRNATRRILALVLSVLPIAQLTWANKDVKSVTCAVCQLAMNYIVDQDISEETIEEICEPNLKVGRWLSQLDMINNPETSTGVQIHDLGKPGECRKECSIVARACRQSALTDDNADEVLAVLAKSRENSEGKDETKSKLQQKFCKKKKSVCGSAGGKKHARSWDDEFVEVDPKLGEMEDMMKDMKAKTGIEPVLLSSCWKICFCGSKSLALGYPVRG